MSAGIGGIGNMGMNIGGNTGAAQTAATAKDPMDTAESMLQKKKHASDSSFAAQLNTLNNNVKTRQVPDVQSGVTGETGTRINKYA